MGDPIQNSDISIEILHFKSSDSEQNGLDFLYNFCMIAINEWVRAARKYAHLTQERLAERMNTSKGNVSGWENSRHKPSFEQMKQLSALTGFPLPLDGEPQPLAPNVTNAPAITLAKALEVMAAQLNLLTDDEREVVAQRLQTLTMAPDSLKAREAVLTKLTPSVQEVPDAQQRYSTNQTRKAA